MENEVSTFAGSRLNNDNLKKIVSGSDAAQLKYARLQGYLEGYLDQMSAAKESQEELVSKILAEISEILNPLTSNNGTSENH